MKVRAEFTVEPFREGQPGAHVAAGVDAVRDAGMQPEIGPFGTAVEGEVAAVAAVLGAVVERAFDAGASRLTLHVTATPATAHPLLTAIQPVAAAMGAHLVAAGDLEPGDVPLRWDGDVVGGFRLPDLQGALARLIAQVEQELAAPLAELSRNDKQRAARLLHERGAFLLRNSADEVADAMAVSRVTLYSYLNAVSAAQPS